MHEGSNNALEGELKNRGVVLVVCETTAYLLTLSLGITGNLFVLLSVYGNTQLRAIPNYFIASLAISDLLLPLLCAPQSITAVIFGRWSFNQDVCQEQGYFVTMLSCATLQILTLTAINRFYHIVRTRHYQRIFTKKKTIIMISLSFSFASLEPLPHLLSGRRYHFHPAKLHVFCFQTTETSFANLLVYVFVGVQTFTLIICYFIVFKKIRTYQQNLQINMHPSSSNDCITHRDIKTTKILFITVVGFLACWTLIAIIDLVDTFRGDVTFPRQVYFLYLILGTLSGVINPLVYGVLNKNFSSTRNIKRYFTSKKDNEELSVCNCNSL